MEFSQAQLNMIYSMAMGYGTEAGSTPYKLTYVSETGKWGGAPYGKSGYSLGVIQFDFGQHSSDVPDFVASVSAWIQKNNLTGFSLPDTDIIKILQSNKTKEGGFKLLSDQDRNIFSAYGQDLGNQKYFFQTFETKIINEGVNGSTKLYGVKDIISDADYYDKFSRMSEADQIRTITMLSKVVNQGGIGNLQTAFDALRDIPTSEFNANSIREMLSSKFAYDLQKGIVRADAVGEVLAGIQSSPVLRKLFDEASNSTSFDLGTVNANPSLSILRSLLSNAVVTAGSDGDTDYFKTNPGVLSFINEVNSHGEKATFSSGGALIGATKLGDIFLFDGKSNTGQAFLNGKWVPVINGDEFGTSIFFRKTKTGFVVASNDDPNFGYFVGSGEVTQLSKNETFAALLASSIAPNDDPLSNFDRQAAADLVLKMADPILLAGPVSSTDLNRLATNYQFNDLYKALLDDPDLKISSNSDGTAYTLFAGNQTYALTAQGTLSRIYRNEDTGQIAMDFMTGKQSGTTLSIAVEGVLTDSQVAALGSNLALSFAPGSQNASLPNLSLNDFNGVVTGTITRTGTDEIVGIHTITALEDDFGNRIGTKVLTTNFEDGVTIANESRSYNDSSRLPELLVSITVGQNAEGFNLAASYSEGKFVGITQIDGLPVSQGISSQIVAALTEQGIINPSPQDLKDALLLSSEDPAITPTAQRIQEVFTSAKADVVIVTDDFGKRSLVTQSEATLRQVGQGIGALTDAFSMIKAIQSGSPLPIVASGLRLAVDLNRLSTGTVIPELGAASSVAGSILSIYSLSQQLKNGDTVGAVTSAGYAVLGAYEAAKFLQASGVISEIPGALGAAGQALDKVMPYVSIVNDLAHGNYVGAAIGAAAIYYNIPYIGWAYAVYNIVSSLFSDEDPPVAWGGGHYSWGGNAATVVAIGENGGQEQVASVLNNFLNTLQGIANKANADNPDYAFGVIPNRLPSLDWRDYQHGDAGWRFTDIDPTTGEERAPGLRYDNDWRAVNAEPGSPFQYQDMGTRFIYSAVERGAIAPWWEVQTARMQTDIGDPRAGLTEEERAARQGRMAGPLPAAPGSTQIFRPVALDLSGDGMINTTDQANGVGFDVDDSGYLKQTAWVSGQDGFLFLDRNFNGVVDEGKELFSNGAVDISMRGLNGLNWVDANQDGDIDADDPVFSQLRIWQDANGNGVEDTIKVNGAVAGHPELKKLSDLGITRLNYRTGTYEQNGQLKLMASPDLAADTVGQTVTPVQGGLLVRTSNGQTSIIVTQISPSSRLDAGADQIDNMYEDVTVLVSPGDLLANDSIGGITGSDPNNGLQISGVFNARHGSVSMDSNGFVRFVPEANYFGNEAGFEYQVTAPTGQTTTAFVDINLLNVNDPPTATVDQHVVPIYGYASAEYAWDGDGQIVAVYPTDPQYEPYYGYDYSSNIYGLNTGIAGTNNFGWQDTAIAQADIDGEHNGSLIVSDPDNSSGFAYEVVGKPAYGDATVDASGNWHYINWIAPDMPGEHWSYILTGEENYDSPPYDGTGYDGKPDAFLIKVTDPAGASSTTQVNVHHVGEYYPNYGKGGGGGGKKPIAIDLDGNGFAFTDVDDSNIFIDINKDGWRHRMAWVNPGDGLLAYDANGDGKINSADEFSFAAYKHGAQTDLEGLQAFDSNNDGIFSSADDKWASFGVWRDANQNGQTDEGELQTLNQLGVQSVSLSSDGLFQIIDGQTVHGMGTVTMSDGSTRQLADVTLKYTNDVLLTLPDGTTKIINKPEFNADVAQIDGTAGKDLLLGSSGNNMIYGHEDDDVIFDDGGNDMIDGGAGNDQIYSGMDNDVIIAGEGNDVVFSGFGNDLALGETGDDVLMLEDGNDIAFGGEGNDFISGGTGGDVLSGDMGNDRLFGEQGRDALFGGDGNDQLFGGDSDDILDGGNGDDILDGGAGADAMNGGAANDLYIVNDRGDSVTENPDEGNDTVNATIDYTLGDNVENLQLTGEALIGIGNAGDNRLYGNTLDNVLIGNAGNDYLDGGLGADNMAGGTGDDIYVVDNAGDVVSENAAEGIDTVRAVISYVLPENVEKLVLAGSEEINGTGNAADNNLIGNSGNNVLDGGEGADLMAGGGGNDTYVVDNNADQVVELAGDGNDTVVSKMESIALATNVENLALDDAEDSLARNGTGNALNNILAGNRADNLLDGGIGADLTAGGTGNDNYIVDNVNDVVEEKTGEGNDTVYSSVSYTLSANVESLVLTEGDASNATGNALDNVIVGNGGNNLLDGSLGADTMSGGHGNDTYIVDHAGDAVIEQASEGVDMVLASVDYTLAANVENLNLTGAAIYGAGNELDNIINGNELGNTLRGAAGNDMLNGSTGNDILDGGAGADAMTGGAGNDIYVVDHLGDQVAENADEGIDAVQSGIDYTLGANVENLALTGSALYGAGNELDNVITANGLGNTLMGRAGNDVLNGGDGNDLLDGGSGADTMIGGHGNDFYIVDDANDVVGEGMNEGSDTVQAGVNYTLTANVENLDLAGSAILGAGNELDNVINANNLGNVLSGDAGNDVLNGGDGNDSLDGGAGADAMKGGKGDDLYMVDHIGDQVVENFSEGDDDVQSSIDYVLTANVENLSLSGSATHGTGNELDNVIVANDLGNVLSGAAGNDVLDGGAGNDVLDGGTGADAMTGGNGDDTYVVDEIGDRVLESLFGGNDTVLSSITYVLPGQVENLTLTGSADLNGNGNELDNIIWGNVGANILDGGSGVDTMSGNAGNDTYIVDDAGDLVIEQIDEGIDTVKAGVDYTLTANVEELVLTGVGDLDGTGNELANLITGNAGNNVLDGGANADTMFGGNGSDTYIVDNAGDIVFESASEGIDTVKASVSYALSANVENLILTGAVNIDGTGNELDNRITGNGGDNVLAGEKGNDVLEGGSGNDTYVYNLNDGLDAIIDASGNDTLSFGAGLTLDNVALRVVPVNGVLTAHLRILDACGCEQQDQGVDFVVSVDGSGRYVSPVKNFVFADGSIKTFNDVLIKTQFVFGTFRTTDIITGRNDDVIFAGPRSNIVHAGTGNDIVYAGARGDTVYGEGGDDYLNGGTGNDLLDGGCGTDVLDGKTGDDTLRSNEDNSALLGDLGRDSLIAGDGNDFIAGGQHNDMLTTGAGKNVVAFNRGDKQDTIMASFGAMNTLSLGGEIDYADLAFAKNGNDLVLSTGHRDSLTFKDWYADVGNRNFVTLQMIEADASDDEHGKSASMHDQQVETFDFLSLADKFDQARLANPNLRSWSLMNGLLDAYQGGSNDAALGGDLAYYYGTQGSLSGMSLATAQNTLKDSKFGASAQQTHQWANISN